MWGLSRDSGLLILGTGLLLSQAALTFVNRAPSQAIVTAGVALAIGPLVVYRDERKHK